jgi:sec-independent protein translocase protein TatA
MEIMAILVVALIVLGPKRLPEAGRQVGKFLAEARRWSRDMQNEIRDVIESEPTPTGSSNGSSEPAAGRPLTD